MGTLREVPMTLRNIPYLAQKSQIRAEILRCAVAGKTIYYSDLGRVLGIPAKGPWKPILDLIGEEERAKGMPDLTYLVVSKETGLPGQIGFRLAKPPTPEQRALAEDTISKVFAYYS
jgi:hypothetical protein